MLGQVRTTACSGSQHIAGGSGAVLMCIRVHIVCDQIVSKGGLWKATFLLARTQLVGQTVVTAWNGSLSSLLKGWTGKCLLPHQHREAMKEVGHDQIYA